MLRHAALSSVLAASLLAAAAAHAAPPPAAAPAPAEAAGLDAARRGVVQVEHGGRPVAVGMVLSKDGRVLTSLSALGTTSDPELRYADGSVVKAKIGHKDKTWDLALLIPQSGRWLDGLVPSQDDPASGELKAFLPKGGKLASTVVGFKGRTDAASKDGESLKSALELDLKGSPSVPGAPILDANGKVVGVLVRACKDPGDAPSSKAAKETKETKEKADKAPPCAPLTVGAPVYALRSFLMKTPPSAVIPAPWLGLGGAPTQAGNFKGVKIMGVAPGSPAEKAGLKAGEGADVIVAVDGQPVETPEQLAETIAKHSIGQTVKFLVFNAGKLRETPVVLRPAP
jgi:serine protease Do